MVRHPVSLTPDQDRFLYADARPDEVFFVQANEPRLTTWGWTSALFRRVSWDCGFHTFILLWVFRWYATETGGAKCDGSRTDRWNKVGGWPGFVMTQTPKEAASFRFSVKRPDRERWSNMGGI